MCVCVWCCYHLLVVAGIARDVIDTLVRWKHDIHCHSNTDALSQWRLYGEQRGSYPHNFSGPKLAPTFHALKCRTQLMYDAVRLSPRRVFWCRWSTNPHIHLEPVHYIHRALPPFPCTGHAADQAVKLKLMRTAVTRWRKVLTSLATVKTVLFHCYACRLLTRRWQILRYLFVVSIILSMYVNC